MSCGGRPVIPIRLHEEEKDELLSIACPSPIPARPLAQPAQIVPACLEAESHMVIAKRLGLSHVTVGKWRRRFHQQGVAGLHDEQRPGPPRTHGDEHVAEVLHTALLGPPAKGSHGSVRALAAHTGIPSPPSIAGSRCSICNPMATAISRSPMILSLWIRWMIL